MATHRRLERETEQSTFRTSGPQRVSGYVTPRRRQITLGSLRTVLAEIRLKRFKAYRDSGDVPLRPLTIVLGPTNSGKSSLLHAILLLAQTVQDTASRQPLVTSGAFVDLGGYYDILWSGQAAKSSRFSIKLKADPATMPYILFAPERDAPGPERPSELSVEFDFDRTANAAAVSSCAIRGPEQEYISVRRAGRGYTLPDVSPEQRQHFNLDFRHFLPTVFPRLSTSRLKKADLDLYYKAEQGSFAWSHLFSGVGHVAPLREPVPRFGILGKTASSELGPGGENLLRVLHSQDEPAPGQGRLVDAVNAWVSGRFHMLGAIRLASVDESGTILSLLADEEKGFGDINVANMGEGLSQLLPIIARVLTIEPGGSLLVEQPEIHLHPAAQADLADLFLSVTQAGDRQCIVETHSEHLLLRVRRRIAEGKIDRNRVAVLYVGRRSRNSTIRSLDLDDLGNFEKWPDGFFEERYREALAIAEAGHRQKTQE
jgi:predicted ATPase